MKSLFEPHMHLVAKVMDLRLQRQNLVIGNLTNIETPGYRPRRLEFEENLQKALNRDARGKMTRTDENHVPVVFDSTNFAGRGEREFKPRVEFGDDSVNMDKEMAILNKNTMLYEALSTVISEGFKGLDKIIAEGSK